jgi:hypothetical protein
MPAPRAVVSSTRGRTRVSRHVGLNLQSRSLAEAPPSTRIDAMGAPASWRHRVDEVGDLQRDAVERGAREVSPRGVAAEARDQPPRGRAQCGAPRPVSAGTNTTSPASGTDAREGFDLRGALDDARARRAATAPRRPR